MTQAVRFPDDPGKGFRLVSENDPPVPVTQPKIGGQPPSKPPKAPPLAASPEPEPERKPEPKKVEVEAEVKESIDERLKRLEEENAQLYAILYYLQHDLEGLKASAQKKA